MGAPNVEEGARTAAGDAWKFSWEYFVSVGPSHFTLILFICGVNERVDREVEVWNERAKQGSEAGTTV